MAGRTVFWVLPAYNEAASIGDLIDRIVEVSTAEEWRFRIIVVDDGSADETGDIARSKPKAACVSVVRNEPNQGLGRTLRRGLRVALKDAGPDDVIVTLDADLTQDPSYVPGMLERIDEGSDVVIASRYRKGSSVEGLSPVRHLLSFAASAFVTLLRPIHGVRDYSCGFRVYRAGVLAEGFEEHGDDFVCESGFGCMVEIAERLRTSADFAEVPFVLRYDQKRKESALNIPKTITAYFRVIRNVAKSNRVPVPVATILLAIGSVVTGSFAQLALRHGAEPFGGLSALAALTGVALSGWVWAGLFLYALSSAMWLGVLSRLELAVAYPIGASGYVLVVLLAWFAGEHVTALNWVGVAMIVFGILLVGWLGVTPRKVARS